jgi:hypothetical protein
MRVFHQVQMCSALGTVFFADRPDTDITSITTPMPWNHLASTLSVRTSDDPKIQNTRYSRVSQSMSTPSSLSRYFTLTRNRKQLILATECPRVARVCVSGRPPPHIAEAGQRVGAAGFATFGPRPAGGRQGPAPDTSCPARSNTGTRFPSPCLAARWCPSPRALIMGGRVCRSLNRVGGWWSCCA